MTLNWPHVQTMQSDFPTWSLSLRSLVAPHFLTKDIMFYIYGYKADNLTVAVNTDFRVKKQKNKIH